MKKLIALGIVPLFILAGCEDDGTDDDWTTDDRQTEETVTFEDDDRADVGDQETVSLSSTTDEDVSGEAELTATQMGTSVMVRLDHGQPNLVYDVALHRGDDCDNPGAQVEEIGEITVNADGEGTITGDVGPRLDQLRDQDHLIVVHHEGLLMSCGSVGGLF